MTQPSTLQDDEISISDIIMKLWRRRGLIVVLPLLSGTYCCPCHGEPYSDAYL